MTTIAILRDGTPVRILLFNNPIFDVDGFLLQFTTPGTTPEIYRYHQHGEFKKEDRKKTNLSGYYDEAVFLKYIQNIEPVPTMELLVKYNFKKVLATEGEEIIVSTIDFSAPYDYFYNYKKYTFNLQSTLDQKGVRNYLKPIIEDLKVVDTKINTDGVNGVTVLNNQGGLPSGHFYKKNLGDFINTWTVSNIQKSNFKKIMALIVFKIKEINRDIIPIIATNTHLSDKEFDVADGITDYNNPTNGLTDLEKLLFDLKRGWGYYYLPTDPNISPLRANFDALFSSISTYNDYLAYYSSLLNFYNKCYRTKDLGYYPSDKKLQYLLEILSSSALGILPYALIIKTIKRYLTIKLSEEDQRVLVRLVMSITPSHANEFLDFLLEKENGAQTNFETIYESLTDARLERYTFVNWFVDEQTNRKYFAFAIFELWKVSKYNLGYIAPGVTANFAGVDPNGYFVINENEFNKNNFLDFSSSYNGSNHKISTLSFQSSIEDKKIKIDKLIRDEHEVDIRNTHDDKTIFFGAFHLYQQISFSGFEANLDLSIPKTAKAPAFLFHFIEEFDRLADFDAAVSLVINLTVDVLLAYFTGGVGVLADLHYLKYTTKIGRALIGSLEASEAVVVWRGLEVGSEVFTLTAGSLTQINTYLITTENDVDKRKILEGYQKVLVPLILLGAGASITARAHATREAERVLDSIDLLPSGVAHGLTTDMMNLLTTLTGEKTVALTTFGNRLNTLDLGGATNTIISKYNTLFTDAQKLKFWNDFQHIDDPAFWKLLNSGKNTINVLDGSYMVNWLNLSERGLAEAKFTDYICKQTRTNDIIRFVDESSIKPVLANLSYERKLKFIDDFGTQSDDWLNYLSANPQAINRWDKLDGAAKLFAKNKPEVWLFRFDRLYENFKKWNRLSDAEILERFGQEGLDLVNEVEAFALNHISLTGSNQRKYNDILISGTKDIKTGKTSKFFKNFSKTELVNGDYDDYIDKMFPNLKTRVDDVITFDKKNYRMKDPEYRKNTGPKAGSHAEVRALDDLAKKKFPDYLTNPPSDEVFHAWVKNDVLGYNRNIQKGVGQEDVIMCRCAHCYHILDLLTFIEPLH
jgi:hypothetical protein